MLEQDMTSLGVHPLLRTSEAAESTSSTASVGPLRQGQEPAPGHRRVLRGVNVEERMMRRLTREMERMVIEARLEILPRTDGRGVDDGFEEKRRRAVRAFGARVREEAREEGAGGSRGSVYGARSGEARLDSGDVRGVSADAGAGEGGSRMATNALPSPVSPVRSIAALQDDAVFVSRADLDLPSHTHPQSQLYPPSQSQLSGYLRGVSAGPEEGIGAAAGELRAWSPLGGVADGGGSALGLGHGYRPGYVRARSKSC